MTTKSKGRYYERKTIKWLEEQGYIVERLERAYTVFRKGQVIRRTSDIWGADLVAKNSEEIIFIQVKTNKKHIQAGVRKMTETIWPECVKLWVLHWPYRARKPEVTIVG